MTWLTWQQRAIQAHIAGSVGESATPLTWTRRAENYFRQTGRARWTPKQRRRLKQKERAS